MTADEARERVGEIRAGADRIMRALSVPDIDWKAAEEAASELVDMCIDMEASFRVNKYRRKETGHGDR